MRISDWSSDVCSSDLLANAKLQSRHRVHDDAWINWNYNEFGWMPDNRTLWLLSKQSGYSHLYLAGADGKARALTSGKWEVSQPARSPDGRTFHFVCNREWPGDYEVCAVPAAGGAVRDVTQHAGVEVCELSHRADPLTRPHSRLYLPIHIAVRNAHGP